MTRSRQLVCLSVTLCFCLPLQAEEPASSGSASDSSAVNVFEGMQARKIEVKLTQRSEKSGTLFLRNPTQETVTVQFPESFVGVHVTNANLVGGGGNGSALPQLSGPGVAQSTGNSINFGNVRADADAPPPESLEDAKAEDAEKKSGEERQVEVPPGKTLQLPVTSVCLEYGKPEPNSKMAYLIIPVEQYSRNPIFHELLPLFAQHRVNQKVAQAAAWHVSNGLTWVELSGIMGQGPVPGPMFNRATLQQASLLVNEAKAVAVKRQAEARKKPAPEPRSRTDRTGKPIRK